MKTRRAMVYGLMMMGAAALPGCGPDWEKKECSDLVTDSDLTSNDKTYQQAIICGDDGTCETQLEDDSGNVFFDCTDGEGTDCISAVVDSQFDYCDVQ